MRKKFDAASHIEALNTIRMNSTVFTISYLKEALKTCGLPSNPLFCTMLRNFSIVIQVNKDAYSFTNSPIHYLKLEEIYNNYRDKVNKYHKTWYDKQRKQNILNKPEIQNAIKLLKANGFEILQKI